MDISQHCSYIVRRLRWVLVLSWVALKDSIVPVYHLGKKKSLAWCSCCCWCSVYAQRGTAFLCCWCYAEIGLINVVFPPTGRKSAPISCLVQARIKWHHACAYLWVCTSNGKIFEQLLKCLGNKFLFKNNRPTHCTDFLSLPQPTWGLSA